MGIAAGVMSSLHCIVQWGVCPVSTWKKWKETILWGLPLMAAILHQLRERWLKSHDLQGFIHPTGVVWDFWTINYHTRRLFTGGINSIVIFSADDWGVLLHFLNAWCLGSITFLRFGEPGSVGNVTCFLWVIGSLQGPGVWVIMKGEVLWFHNIFWVGFWSWLK